MKCADCIYWDFEETDKIGRRWGMCRSGHEEIEIMNHSPPLFSEHYGCIFFDSGRKENEKV